MTVPQVSLAWRRAARRLAALTLGGALVMFAASQIWKDWIGWMLLPWALAPAPLALWLANRLVPAGRPHSAAVIGLGVGALVQLLLAWGTVEQYLLVVWNIRITGAYAESLYGLVVVFAPFYVAPAPLLGLLAGLVMRSLSQAAGPHSPR